MSFPVLAKTIFSFDFAQLPTYIILPNLRGVIALLYFLQAYIYNSISFLSDYPVGW